MSDRTEAERLADRIAFWHYVWTQAEQVGLAFSAGGPEWERALARYLALSDDEREEWMDRPEDWQLRNCHFDAGSDEVDSEVEVQHDRPEWVPEDDEVSVG